ncbi:NF-kappa-B inhibitor-interacting Ras-like protein 1 isoform X1 [Erpetoichthys calabaricus]|uniref:NFKB inhibitor interacting Ras-like 1 n=1 Tax=Erpetoichthys calabaricus TaxID=27687 RepID=A0A8C4T8S3_ERPCA|nr:NF-kappa-B inhibitor-interacting Ras-like protein 1 isoform X1 [Erpetoichthys calabaricus]
MGKGWKVVICGLASVGKTAILEQLLYANHQVGSESNETLEDVYLASVETDKGVKEQLRLYDTKGLQDDLELPKHYFSLADGFVLVYSVDSMESFKKVDALKKDIDKFRDKKEVTMIVLGNKSDLQEQRQVDLELAQQWAKEERVKLWEVTVSERKTLIEPFTVLTSRMTQHQSKSAFPLPGRKNKGAPSSDL